MDNPAASSSPNSAAVDSPVPEYKQPSKLIFILGGAILLILGLIVGYYFSQKSMSVAVPRTTPSPIPPLEASDEMEWWKTYRNEEYGYTLKYPPASSTTTCKLQDADFPSQRVEEGILYISIIPGDPCGPVFLIAHHSNSEGLEPLEFFKSRSQKWGVQLSCEDEQSYEFDCTTAENDFPTEEYKLTKKNISNHNGYQIDPIRNAGLSIDEVIIPAGQSQMMVITFHASALTNQILSTFEFIESATEE